MTIACTDFSFSFITDCVWLNMNLIMQMGTIDVSCMQECLQLGLNQSDTDDRENGCKLRPDEGLDAIRLEFLYLIEHICRAKNG